MKLINNEALAKRLTLIDLFAKTIEQYKDQEPISIDINWLGEKIPTVCIHWPSFKFKDYYELSVEVPHEDGYHKFAWEVKYSNMTVVNFCLVAEKQYEKFVAKKGDIH